LTKELESDKLIVISIRSRKDIGGNNKMLIGKYQKLLAVIVKST
jgi:hypothetical protein